MYDIIAENPNAKVSVLAMNRRERNPPPAAARAALACAVMGTSPPQLIILDEPTNHLDLESVAAVEAALSGYDGALLVVSHDRDFLEAIGVDRELML